MARDLKQVDDALGIAEKAVDTHTAAINRIKAQLGAIDPKESVADRLGAIDKPGGRLDVIDKKIADMSAMIKTDRMIFLGYAIAGSIVKLDIQAIKIDLTLLKKIDEKNVFLLKGLIERLQKGVTTTGQGSVYRWIKDKIFKEAAADRRTQEETEKKKKEKEEKHEERLQRHIRDLPRKVNLNTKDIEKILGVLRGARNAAQTAREDRTGLARNHKGVDAQQPKVGPVAKDVRNLRTAVDELIQSLGSL